MLRSCLLLVALLLAPAAAHAVSFFDGVFNPADWGVMTGGSGASTSIQMLAGGNPDEYLEITNKPTPPVAGATVRGFHLHSSFVYDPGASGAIASAARCRALSPLRSYLLVVSEELCPARSEATDRSTPPSSRALM